MVLLEQLDVSIHSGQLVCLLGPNGSGKTTLLRTLAGLIPAVEGEILIGGCSLRSSHVKQTSRLLSVVLTQRIEVRNLTVHQLVSMGRYPYNNWLGQQSSKDHELIQYAISQVRLEGFEHRFIHELSDGEQQRVMIAKALCQDTPLIILDEPTAHLDLPNRVSIMNLLRTLARETGKGILFSSHELDLAIQAADTLWLIRRGEALISGLPEDLVLSGAFEETFNAVGVDFDKTTGSFKMHREPGIPIFCEGNATEGFWTHRALEREGYQISDNRSLPVQLFIRKDPSEWILKVGSESWMFSSLGEMIRQLRQVRAPGSDKNG